MYYFKFGRDNGILLVLNNMRDTIITAVNILLLQVGLDLQLAQVVESTRNYPIKTTMYIAHPLLN